MLDKVTRVGFREKVGGIFVALCSVGTLAWLSRKADPVVALGFWKFLSVHWATPWRSHPEGGLNSTQRQEMTAAFQPPRVINLILKLVPLEPGFLLRCRRRANVVGLSPRVVGCCCLSARGVQLTE